MITQANLFAKQCQKLAVLVALTTSTVGLTAQKTLAIPLEPILDQMGRRMIEGLVGTDSDGQAAQATPLDSQSFTDTQQETDFSQYQKTASPPQYPTSPSPTYPPAYPQNSPPSTYPQGYSTYPQVTPPQYPTSPPPTYPPAYSPPTYSSPAPQPGQSTTPIIINNF